MITGLICFGCAILLAVISLWFGSWLNKKEKQANIRRKKANE